MSEHHIHAPYCADRAVQRTVAIIENRRVALGINRLRFETSDLLRGGLVPGQFFMLRPAGGTDPLIGRPLAFYSERPSFEGSQGIEVMYLVKGKFTRWLADQGPGSKLSVWGPLGNGFSLRPVRHLIMIAGGIGQTPMLSLGGWYSQQSQWKTRVTMLYGARTFEHLPDIDDFHGVATNLRISTDDGSRGHHGFVTDLLEQELDAEGPEPFTGPSGDRVRIACCGPEPMMEAVAKIATRRQVPCEISLETPMACGIGICFTCVAKVRDESGWDYKRTCVEGPIFPAEKIEW